MSCGYCFVFFHFPAKISLLKLSKPHFPAKMVKKSSFVTLPSLKIGTAYFFIGT